MTAEVSALITLGGYLAGAVSLVIRSVLRCEDGPGVWLLYLIERLYVPLMFRWRATNGPSPLPSQGGALIIANHRSPADPLMVWMNHHLRGQGGERTIRVIEFLTAREYSNPSGLGWIVRTMRSILVDRDGQDIRPAREAIRRLKNGRIVGIFPEGGIGTGCGLREANTGVAFLALKAGVPVYPIFIQGVEYDGVSDIMVAFFRRQRVRVTYGKPVDLSEYSAVRPSQETLTEVTNLLMARLAELGNVDFTPVGSSNEADSSDSGDVVSSGLEMSEETSRQRSRA